MMQTIDLAEKIRNGAQARKSRAGFALGQNWIDGSLYVPTPVGYHGAYLDADYARKAIEQVICTSMYNARKYWGAVFDRWVATEQYQEFQSAFEPARAAAKSDYHSGGKTAEKIGREILAANLELLPEEVLAELEGLYQL